MSGNTLPLHSAVQILPATVTEAPAVNVPTGKPLGYFANLPYSIETTPLSQPQLRQLIVRLLSRSSANLRLDKPQNGFFPTWINENWDTLCTDPAGIVRWAVQYLQNREVNN